MQSSPSTIFFGASQYVLPTIDMLQKAYDLKLVVTTEMSPNDAVPTFCTTNNIPYISVAKFESESLDRIKQVNAALGVLGYFGIILPEHILNLFPKGILNIHPSLLPKYRGATPVQSAILNGDTETGVTIILLDKEMDHGPILQQEKEPILPNDTTTSLHNRLFTKGAALLTEIIPNYLEDTIKLQEQDHTKAIFTQRALTRQHGFFDVDKPPSPIQLDRMIRAYFPWPGVWTKMEINGQQKIVKFLPEKRLQVEGKKAMSLKDFSNGYPQLKQLVEKLLV